MAGEETGDINTYVHIWIYENAEDRNRRRAALYKDPEWLKYIEMNSEAGYLIKQESKLMSPAPFAPLKEWPLKNITNIRVQGRSF